MKTTDAISYFGERRKVAEVLGISAPSIYCWGELVPEKNAARLAAASGGALVYDPGVYDAYRARKSSSRKAEEFDGYKLAEDDEPAPHESAEAEV